MRLEVIDLSGVQQSTVQALTERVVRLEIANTQRTPPIAPNAASDSGKTLQAVTELDHRLGRVELRLQRTPTDANFEEFLRDLEHHKGTVKQNHEVLVRDCGISAQQLDEMRSWVKNRVEELQGGCHD